MAHYSRRQFIKTGLAAGALASTGSLPLKADPQTATDLVTLGNSGVKVTRLAFGTGSFSGQVQRDLGQEQFTRLVRHAHERGIRFFETAESYAGMHQMLGIALKGVPRDSYQLMTKLTTHNGVDPQAKIDELRRHGEYRILRHRPAPLATYCVVANRQPAMAGRDFGSSVEEGCAGSRRFGAWAAGVAPDPGYQVAGDCHDPHEP